MPRWYKLKDKWVTLRGDPQKTCYDCGTWFVYHDKARYIVLSGGGEFLTFYTCRKCNEGKADSDWTRLFAEETQPDEQEDVETIYRELTEQEGARNERAENRIARSDHELCRRRLR